MVDTTCNCTTKVALLDLKKIIYAEKVATIFNRTILCEGNHCLMQYKGSRVTIGKMEVTRKQDRQVSQHCSE